MEKGRRLKAAEGQRKGGAHFVGRTSSSRRKGQSSIIAEGCLLLAPISFHSLSFAVGGGGGVRLFEVLPTGSWNSNRGRGVFELKPLQASTGLYRRWQFVSHRLFVYSKCISSYPPSIHHSRRRGIREGKGDEKRTTSQKLRCLLMGGLSLHTTSHSTTC